MKKVKIILCFFLIFLSTTSVYATTNTKDRNSLNNYGVNKKFKITDANRSNVLKTKSVDATERIYDFAEILTEEEEKELKKKIDDFVEKNRMDMIIVTDRFTYNNDSENDTYASDFYDYNDFGMSYNDYRGILFLRNANERDPYYDMYTFGDAQLYFSQDRYDDILDSIYSKIKSGAYLEGLTEFIEKTDKYIQDGKTKEADNYYIDDYGKIHSYYKIPWIICIGASSTITLIVMIIMISNNKMIAKERKADIYLDKKSVNISNRKDIFITSHTSSYTSSSSSSGGGGGFSSHTGSSGGGFSSGGGRHG